MTDLTGHTLLNRYFLREHIGSGGMADVYQSWDNLRSAWMAVKVLRRDLAATPRFFQLFAKEAEWLRKLEHPNIVRLYEFDRDNDIIFIVMEWVDGASLFKKITDRKEPFSLDDISRILQPVCSALFYAHKKQVFHCDVKPSNIMEQKNGQILLTDFGVARLATDEVGGGTPQYMAPEQFSGGAIDARTDIYSLGVTLYEMLSGGRVPYSGDSSESLGSTLRERVAWELQNMPLPPLRKYNNRVPEAVETVICMAISKDPNHRFASTMELREAFEHARLVDERGRGKDATVIGLKPTSQTKKAKYLQKQKRLRDPHLYGRSGERSGQEILIDPKGLSIGRSRKNALQLRERSVSRRHALIWLSKNKCYIRDENSSLGTYVNGQRIYKPIILQNGDVIQIGYYQVFEFRK